MIMAIDPIDLTKLVSKQLKNLFQFNYENEYTVLEKGIQLTLPKIQNCFYYSKNKYYKKNNSVYFNPFHSGQYTIFLYFLSRSIYLMDNNKSLADRVYYLNKTLNGLDLFYEIKMPNIFELEHPVGSVIGRARIGDYFSFFQGCTVGASMGFEPVIGENVTMYAHSKILGKSCVGNNVWISANTYIIDTNIPEQSIVFGSSPNIVIKSRPVEFFKI